MTVILRELFPFQFDLEIHEIDLDTIVARLSARFKGPFFAIYPMRSAFTVTDLSIEQDGDFTIETRLRGGSDPRNEQGLPPFVFDIRFRTAEDAVIGRLLL